MKEVSAEELKQMMDNNEDFVLVDVREPYEYEEANLGGVLIPMGEIMERYNEIPRDKKVVIHCRAGSRSATIVNLLETQFGYTEVYNLRGGILAFPK